MNEYDYVFGAFNEPTYVSDHYSPVEIAHLNIYADNNQDYVFYTGKVNENLSFLMALPSKNWHRVVLEFDDQWIIQFLQIMFVIAAFIFILIGYIFSRRIANPVAQIIEGVKRLAD